MKPRSATSKRWLLRCIRLLLPLCAAVVLLLLAFKLARHDLTTRELRILTAGAVLALAFYGGSLWREARTL